jgi:hypothetical protein
MQRGIVPAHFTLQAPQLIASERLASHPSSGREEQCPKPAAQAPGATTQAPLRHSMAAALGLTFGRLAQSWPHAPQFLGSSSDPQPGPSTPTSAAAASLPGPVPPASTPPSSPGSLARIALQWVTATSSAQHDSARARAREILMGIRRWECGKRLSDSNSRANRSIIAPNASIPSRTTSRRKSQHGYAA